MHNSNVNVGDKMPVLCHNNRKARAKATKVYFFPSFIVPKHTYT